MQEIESSTSDEELPKVFLHVNFAVPAVVAESSRGREMAVTITKQYFDASNCNPAIIGLPHGIEPTKAEPGDYSYSGMHDHGILPAPKEDGQFAQIIGLVSAAKKASDVYLTELIVIEREKTLATSERAESAQGENPKRKRL